MHVTLAAQCSFFLLNYRVAKNEIKDLFALVLFFFLVLYWFTQLAGEIHTEHSTLDHSNIKNTGSKTYSLRCQLVNPKI
jgi:Ca2+/Na+ antiporter